MYVKLRPGEFWQRPLRDGPADAGRLQGAPRDHGAGALIDNGILYWYSYY